MANRLSIYRRSFLALFIVAGVLAGCSPESDERESTDDYLATDFRSQVEQLKLAVAAEPTSESTIAQRAELLADWIDEYALAGGEVGVDPPRIRLQSSLPPTGNQAVVQSRNLDKYVREFTLREEEGALGFLMSENLGPFEAGGFASLSQTWRVGSRPMTVGGGFWVARHFAANFGAFQTDDPGAAGYVSLTSTDDDAEFEIETITATGPHGGFRGPQPAIAFRLVAGELDRGSTVTITHGDQTAGGPGIRVPSSESERMPLPLYIDLDGSGEWRPLPITPFVISGGTTAGVHGFASSVVEPGESFELSVRAEDRFSNRATGAIPAFEVLVNGELYATTEAGPEAITLLDMSLEEAGSYWISLRSADGSISGEANPVLVESNPESRIYWGDTHAHSGYSEGIGTADYFMRFARDDARLDFVTHSEHDTWLDAGEWEIIRAASAKYDEPGKFIPYLGWEWTRHTRFGGHHNVLFRDIGDQQPVSGLSYPVLSQLYEQLRVQYDSNDIVVIPHAHNPGDFRQSDPQLEPLIEIMSAHGSFGWFMRGYLSHGHEVGVIAASDDHLSRPGYSSPNRDTLAQRGGLGAVMAPERSRDAIFDGMKSKHTYATTGDRIILRMDVNGTGMGERAAFSEERAISGRVIATAPIRNLTLYKNDVQLWQQDYLLEESAAAEQEILLSFFSDETPHFRGDAPRGWRHWRGELRVDGARLETATAMDFVNPTTQSLQQNGNSLSFRTHTRGDTSSIRLSLSDIEANATISLSFEEATETGSAPPFYRTHVTIPASEAILRLGDLQQGILRHTMPAQNYADDSITLRRLTDNGVKDTSFEFTDTENPDQGDYYYLKVEQVNDAAAWSSPIWVGGFPSR